jgi:hypothetical protein
MATDLTNVAVSTGFTQLLHIDGGIGGSVNRIYDGDGTGSPLEISSTTVQIKDGSFDFNVASHDGTNGLKLGGTLVTATAAELNYVDVSSIGTAEASKAIILDSNKDITGIRNLTATGTIQAANFTGTGNTTIGDAASDTIAMNATITTDLIFEGSSADANELTLTPGDPGSDITITLPGATDTLVGRATSDTLTNKGIDADNNTLSNIEVDNLKSGVLDTDITSVSGSDDTIASAKAIKTYVDAQVTAQDLDATTDSGTIAIDLDSETLTIAGGEGIDTSATSNTITIAGEDASTSNKGVASFSSDNFAVSSGAVTIKDNGVILATETTGDYVQNITGGTGIDSTGATSGENIAHTLSIDLNELATETSIADDDFIAMVDATDSASGKITFENLEDAIFASVSGDIAIAEDGTATIQANSVAMATDTTGDFVNSITAGTGITSTGATSGENISHSLSIDAAQTGITSLLATDIKIGEDNETKIDFEDADKINFYAGNEKQLILEDGALYPGSDNIIDIGKSDNEFKDGFFDGTVTADAFAGPLTGNADTATLSTTVTVSDSSANTNFPVVFHNESNGLLDDTGALRYNPSTGELLVPKLTVAGATTTVDTVTMNAANAIIFEGATADSNETTLSIVDPTSDHTQYLINQGGYIPVLAAATTTAITSTPEELNILDGVTSTASELNILDGVTSTTAELNILDGVTSTTAELNILDGVTASAADINLIDGITNGTVIASKAIIADSSKDISGGRNITISGELDAATLDISGDADIDGTLEADAYTVDGTALDEFISDTVGAMVGSNTETGIAVTYDDSDNTLDFVLGASQTSLTSLLNASLVAGRDADNQIKFSTDDQIIFRVAGGDGVTMKASGEIEATSLDISGDIDVDGTTNLDVVDIDGAVNVSADLTTSGHLIIDADDKALVLGADQDASIWATDVGNVYIGSGQDYTLSSSDTEGWFNFKVGTSAESFLNIVGGEGGASSLYMTADQADDNADRWRLQSDTSGNFTISTYSTGSYTTPATIKSDGKFGVGIDAPASNVHIHSDDETLLYITTDAANRDTGLWFGHDYDGTGNYSGIVFDQSADALKIFNANSLSDHLVIDNSGNLGLGATSPGAKLYSLTASASEAAAFFLSDNDSGSAAVLVRADSSSGTRELIKFYNGGGLVGDIKYTGTSLMIDAPDDIYLDAGGGDIVLLDDGTHLGTIKLSTSALRFDSQVSDQDITFTGNDGGSAITAMTIDMSEGGRVGIGTTFGENIASSVSKFAVRSDTGSSHYNMVNIWEHDNSTTGIEQRIGWAFGDDGGGESSFGFAGYVGMGKEGDWVTDANRDAYMTFATAKDNTVSEQMRILSSGRVWFQGGTNFKTSTIGSVDRLGMIDMYDDAGYNPVLHVMSDREDPDFSPLRLTGGHNNPSSASQCIWIDFHDGDGTHRGGIQNGSTADNPEFFNGGSDERIKTNIVDTATNGLQIINGLELKDFTVQEWYNGYSSDVTCDFVAQNAEEHFPDMVSEHKMKPKKEEFRQDFVDAGLEAVEVETALGTEEMFPVKCISHSALIPILVKALQEADNKVNALTARIEALEA